MTYKENIRAILECYFTGSKEEIINSACNHICNQEMIDLNEIYDEICNLKQKNSYTFVNIDNILSIIARHM